LYIPLFFFLFFFFFLCIPTKVYYDYCATESFLSRVPSSSVLEDVSEVCSLLLHLWSHGWKEMGLGIRPMESMVSMVWSTKILLY